MPRCFAFSSASAAVVAEVGSWVVVMSSSVVSNDVVTPPSADWRRRSSNGSVLPAVLDLYWLARPIRVVLGARPAAGTPGEGAMSGYGQFCPVAKAMEVLDERWTMLVIRELLLGSRRFNDLRRGNPRMSPALLSKRLRSLEKVGIVRRDLVGGHASYSLTEAGLELEPIVNGLGAWGVRWISQLGDSDLDPHLLLWDIRRTVPVESWPRSRTVVAFRFEGTPPRQARWWLVVADGEADVCDVDPGYDVEATVHTSLRTLTEIWRGDTTWERAVGSGAVQVEGPAEVRRALPTWIGQGSFADIPRIA